ncbi:hypothetical protein CDAR_247631 [Caerostris darwini]|uniref:Ribosomal protein L2 n=1 Tax=Caerostris darwini TaxID=1538125 RepID=A0AAV4TBP2_9ARAC|nr:hypothetical protein CDAR_247631 [Caerostris darwini]
MVIKHRRSAPFPGAGEGREVCGMDCSRNCIIVKGMKGLLKFKRPLTQQSTTESTRSYGKFNQLVKVGVILIPFPTNSPLHRPIICPYTRWETVACPHKPGSRYSDVHKTPEVSPIPWGGGKGGKSGERTVAGIASSLKE